MRTAKTHIATAAVTVLLLCFIEVVPPRASTEGRMRTLGTRLIRYVQREQKWPISFDDLPPEERKCNEIVDAWGRRIEWSAVGSVITLRSLGADGKAGGTDDDADLTHSIELLPDRGILTAQ